MKYFVTTVVLVTVAKIAD